MGEYYRQVELVEGTLVQVIGVHPVMWRDVLSGYKDQPDYGFVEAPEVADLLAALEAVEWVPSVVENIYHCPWCDGPKPYQYLSSDGAYQWAGGHCPDCSRQLALAKARIRA